MTPRAQWLPTAVALAGTLTLVVLSGLDSGPGADRRFEGARSQTIPGSAPLAPAPPTEVRM